jgi:hypothetical protein
VPCHDPSARGGLSTDGRLAATHRPEGGPPTGAHLATRPIGPRAGLLQDGMCRSGAPAAIPAQGKPVSGSNQQRRPRRDPMVLCRLTAGCFEARGGAHSPDFLCVPKESQQRKGTPRRARGLAAGSLRALTGGGRSRTRPALPGSDSTRSIRRRPSVLGAVEGKGRSPNGGSHTPPINRPEGGPPTGAHPATRPIGPRAGLLQGM